MRLNVKAFAVTCGLFWGFALLFITWWIILLDGPSHDKLCIGHVYRGYEVSVIGSVVGLIWGLIDGFIGGAIFAWLYNLLVVRLTKTS